MKCLRNDDRGQAAAVEEGKSLNAGDALWDDDRGQAFAMNEGR